MSKKISFIITVSALKVIGRQLLIWLGAPIVGGWFVSLPYQYIYIREPHFYQAMESDAKDFFTSFFIFAIPIIFWFALLCVIWHYQNLQGKQQLPARDLALKIIQDGGFNKARNIFRFWGATIGVLGGGGVAMVVIGSLFIGEDIRWSLIMTAFLIFSSIVIWGGLCAAFLTFILAGFYFLGVSLINPNLENGWYLTSEAGQAVACRFNIWPYRQQIKIFWLLILLPPPLYFMISILMDSVLINAAPVLFFWSILGLALLFSFLILRSLLLLLWPRMLQIQGDIHTLQKMTLSSKIDNFVKRQSLLDNKYNYYVICRGNRLKINEDTYFRLQGDKRYRFWFSAWMPGKMVAYELNPLRLSQMPFQSLKPLPQPISRADLPMYLADLNHDQVDQREQAYQALLTLGGLATPGLAAIAAGESSEQQAIATWLIYEIEQETKHRFASQCQNFLCPDCLVRCHHHQNPTFYGCRACRRSYDLMTWAGQIVAVLDRAMTARYVEADDVLRVNGLQHQQPFDFDRVEIIQATDEEVERFVVQVTNDTDPVRQPRFRTMACVVAPGCNLSENTLRILRRTFAVEGEMS